MTVGLPDCCNSCKHKMESKDRFRQVNARDLISTFPYLSSSRQHMKFRPSKGKQPAQKE
jgi:hypothetical protein